MAELRGITWRHSRGFTPLAAASQLYNDIHPETSIAWDIRSLWSFGEEPLDRFAKKYDLVVWDYPFAGAVAASGCFVPLDELCAADEIRRFENAFVGPAYGGFSSAGRQWALPIDAACQVAAARTDILEARGFSVPQAWDEIVELARDGLVAMPLRPMGIWASFLSLCGQAGDVPFTRPDIPFDREIGATALARLAQLVPLLDPRCFELFPTALFSEMTNEDAVAYVPLAYGYSAYSNPNYARRPLTFLSPVADGPVFRGATYGGAGISVSSQSANKVEAAGFMAWLVSDQVQCGVVKHCFGQPSARAAWAKSETLNGDFYVNTLATIEHAFSRPTVPAFHHFQSESGALLCDAFREDAVDINAVLGQLEAAYRHHLVPQLFPPR